MLIVVSFIYGLDSEIDFVWSNKIDVVTSTEEAIDTSNWKTYRNEEYGFEFKYPEGWVENNRPAYPFNINIISYKDAPVILDKNMYAGIPTKDRLAQFKKELDNRGNIYIDGIKALKTEDFDVPSGSFYERVSFFIGQDLVEILYYLPLGPFGYNEQEKIEAARNNIKLKQIDQRTITIIDNFNIMVKSIKLLK